MSIPSSVVAACWVPLLLLLLLALLLSTCFVLWHRSAVDTQRCWKASAVASVSITATAITAALAPIDVFLVSAMKFRNGTYKSWAEDASDRASMEATMLYTYYGFYLVLLALLFLLLPLLFFYHVLWDENEEESRVGEAGEGGEGQAVNSRLWGAAKWTSVSLMILTVLVLIGIFVPWGDVQDNLTRMYLSEVGTF